MSETTATVQVVRGTPYIDTGEPRIVVLDPDGGYLCQGSADWAVSHGLPVPPVPIPDPPESGTVRDAYATVWVEECGGCWINVHGGRQTWPKLIATRGPLTALIPGDPIEAP